MQAYRLIPHPAHPPINVSGVDVHIRNDNPNWLRIRCRIDGCDKLVLPRIAGKSRADGLWKTTCFELFLQTQRDEAYVEWNFSPSRKWNAYSFTRYREGMNELSIPRAPDSQVHRGSKFTLIDVAIPRAALPTGDCSIGLSAVIEENDGAISYWALAHASEEKPDFHDPACFAAKLPAPQNI